MPNELLKLDLGEAGSLRLERCSDGYLAIEFDTPNECCGWVFLMVSPQEAEQMVDFLTCTAPEGGPKQPSRHLRVCSSEVRGDGPDTR